jgi:flagellar assembly protein FliH
LALIKHNTASAAAAKPFNMSDIESHARSMLLRAKQQADQLLAAAQTEADAMRAQAHAEGMSQGLAEGKKEGLAQGKTEGVNVGKTQAFDAEKAKLTELLKTLSTAAAELATDREELNKRAEAEVLPLALTIARKVTKRMGALDPAVVEANAREAVRLITTKHDIRIVIHPDQLTLMREVAGRLKQQWPQLNHVHLDPDPAVAPGGCRVLTVGGGIDADLDAQLDRIAAELLPENVQ